MRTADGPNGLSFKLSVRQAPVEDLMVFAWTPLHPGVEKASNYSYLSLVRDLDNGQIDFTELYLRKLKEWTKLKDKRYHAPLPGSKICVRVCQQINGWQNELGMFSASAFVPAEAP